MKELWLQSSPSAQRDHTTRDRIGGDLHLTMWDTTVHDGAPQLALCIEDSRGPRRKIGPEFALRGDDIRKLQAILAEFFGRWPVSTTE